MCGILFTTKKCENLDLNYIIQYLKFRGPDITSIQQIDKYLFIHTLLSMTGSITEQPFVNYNKSVICMFNGEIYNFENFGKYNSDGECLIPLYEKYGIDFIKELDGEFSLILLDLNKNIIIISTDIFGTRPLWFGFDEKDIGVSSYKSCLDRLNFKSIFQVLANKTYIYDLNKFKIIDEKRVHTFDLTQKKNSFDDWNIAFSKAITKRVKYAKTGIFIGMSGGYDSGAIACELTKQNINFTAYSIINVEDKQVMNERQKKVKDTQLIELSREEFLNARNYLKKNAEEYTLNIDNGEKDKYNDLIKNKNYDKNRADNLLKIIEFRKNGQLLTDDNGAIGCSYICSLAIKNNQKIYLSGSGADEIFSDYGFNKYKYFDHSTIGGYFPEDLSTVFPWKNFFGNTQRAYLMKEEYVAGSYGVEGRYPYLDKNVVQEFLWLTPELKNKNYKSPLFNYLTINNFPFEINQKTGFGCGFAGPSTNGIEYQTLSDTQKNNIKIRKVTDEINSQIVDFNKLLLKNSKSYESYFIINKSEIIHIKGNCYSVKININYPGLKFTNKSRYSLLENNYALKDPVTNHEIIINKGSGTFCFWASDTLYFSTSDNSDPRINDKEYSIIKLNNNLRNLSYENSNEFNNKKYYILILIKNCDYNTTEYFKIREILNYYNFIPNIISCDNNEIFMDLPNIKFEKYNTDLKSICRITIEDILNMNIDKIRDLLFDVKNYDDGYKIIKGINQKLTITILSVGNSQFKYAIESALRQDLDICINIVKNRDAVDAMNTLLNRCVTKYNIQMDEDMIFFTNNSADLMLNKIIEQSDNVWNFCFSLKDENFGIGENKQLLGIKIFNIDLMKKNNLCYSNKNSFALDRVIQVIAKEKNLANNWTVEQIGYHQKNFEPIDLFLRCAKISKELLNSIENWGNYEYGIFLRYITKYSYNEFLLTSLYIINKFEKDPKIFFDKLKNLTLPNYFNDTIKPTGYDIYDVNINNLIILDEIKKDIKFPIIENYYPNKKIEFYCMIGFIYSFYYDYDYDYDYKNYPIELLNKFN